MELFLLGVGNYSEDDVIACARAWTGHTQDWSSGLYQWRADLHDPSPKSLLGRTINLGADWTLHGNETIDVVLGQGTIPSGPNAGRPTRHVAAEFLSRKLWRFFAGTDIPAAVLSAMRNDALAADFEVRPWLRSMLLRPEFYAADVKQGLVRSPTSLMVAFHYHTGLRASGVLPLWWMDGMGQRPLFPPDVSGWKSNGFFVNSSALGYRALAARFFMWNTMLGFWAGDGLIHLGGGTISRAEAESLDGAPEQFVDLLLARLRVTPKAHSRAVLDDFARSCRWSDRIPLIMLVLMLPELQLA